MKKLCLLGLLALGTAIAAAVLLGGCSENGVGGAFYEKKLADGGSGSGGGSGGGNYNISLSCGDRACGTKTIGAKMWMTENLNYETPSGSWCYENSNDSCDKYGRLYTWDAATKACPSGWKLPSREDWNNLVATAGGQSTAGSKLKSTSGWNLYSGISSTDAFGFSALPGGLRNSVGNFNDAGYYGHWWTAAEVGSGNAYRRVMDFDSDGVGEYYGGKSHGFSVRCVKE